MNVRNMAKPKLYSFRFLFIATSKFYCHRCLRFDRIQNSKNHPGSNTPQSSPDSQAVTFLMQNPKPFALSLPLLSGASRRTGSRRVGKREPESSFSSPWQNRGIFCRRVNPTNIDFIPVERRKGFQNCFLLLSIALA